MLGMEISDPQGTEHKGSIRGMGLLPVRTVFGLEKTRTRVRGRFLKLPGILRELSGREFEGYEIHMGATVLLDNEDAPAGALAVFSDVTGEKARNARSAGGMEEICESGNVSTDGSCRGNVYGCYVHGIFDAPECAGGFVSAVMKEKGYDSSCVEGRDWNAYKDEQYDRLADILRESLDMERIYEIIEKGNDAPCIL